MKYPVCIKVLYVYEYSIRLYAARISIHSWRNRNREFVSIIIRFGSIWKAFEIGKLMLAVFH